MKATYSSLYSYLSKISWHIVSRRAFLILAGILVCVYAIVVLVYVQTIPDIGLKTIFGTTIRASIPLDEYNPGPIHPEKGDEIVEIAGMPVDYWPDVLNAPFALRAGRAPLEKVVAKDGSEVYLAEVEFKRDGQLFKYRCPLSNLPLEHLAPSVLWFFLKMLLFSVGALVLWKRPTDTAAALFFLLCVVTLGAFMGGYHWNHIASAPPLLLVFMVCAVLLPVVSLHFYFAFPRKKQLLVRHPRWTLTAIYAVPVAFLALLILQYFHLRGLLHPRVPRATFQAALREFQTIIYLYFGVASLWYLACIGSLVHSYLTVTDTMERNQVKWILFGALMSLVPINYSLYLALGDPDAFAAGAATWPMFAASACLTAAFAVSITRYRLMELDKIISSGVGYFLISFLFGLVYYAVVFLGTLVFNQVIAGPKLSEALTVSTTALILMIFLDMARARFMKALDRRFSRDKSQLDRTLHQLGQAVQQLVDPPAVAQRLLQATTELMGVARGSVFLRQGTPPLFKLVGSLGGHPALTELSSGCPLIEALREGNVVSLRQRSIPGQTPAQRQLQLIGGEIAHPLAHEGELLALLVLGPRGAGYRAEDFHLLAAFTQITVLALESAEGHQTIEQLNGDLQAKVEKISEQQRRILALQSQLRRQTPPAEEGKTKEDAAAATPDSAAPPASPGGMVGSGPIVQQLLSLVRKVATTDAVVLIRGESGTGKELLARAIHETSARNGKPYVKVHCAALSANLLESELFGHVKGSFTGAHRDKVGRFEMANGGTLFLDEIGDINLEVQTKLLRVLQERTLERVGSSEPVQVDVRIITATHQNLEDLIRQGRFREDLYYRLNVFPMQMPPLRDHAEDIPELALYFMRQSAGRCRKEITQIDDDAMLLLKAHTWPGNIRQLENVIERAVVICDRTFLSVHELPEEIADGFAAEEEAPLLPPAAAQIAEPEPRSLPRRRAEREQLEREKLVRLLAAADGNKSEAARAMGIARSTLVSRLKKLGLN